MLGPAGHGRYTVGWVCAVHAAARAFLDDEHDGQTATPNDDTLERVRAHNVVIAGLPSGEYGISAASTNMVRSCPNVRVF